MRKCLVLLLLVAGASAARASEPRVHIMGVWPDRMRYFDEKSDDFVAELRVRRGAVWHHDAALLPDASRLYVITDRLESVEVIDLAERAVVDEFKLSTDSRKVRFLRIAVDPSGKRAYLSVRSVLQESDRLIPERPYIVVYDLDAHEVAASFEPPRGVDFNRLGISPDGSLLLLFGRDIHLLSTTSYEVVDKIVLSELQGAGYGPLQVRLWETEPGFYYGVYRTTEPIFEKSMFGVGRLDLGSRQLETFEFGPAVLDMENTRLLARKEGFEQGRPNGSLIVSGDGKKLYSSGARGHDSHLRLVDVEPHTVGLCSRLSGVSFRRVALRLIPAATRQASPRRMRSNRSWTHTWRGAGSVSS